MNKNSRPEIICHMTSSIDGRIDCAMVDKIGGDEYYTTLEQLDSPSYLNGRVTMEHYNAEKVPFTPKNPEPVGMGVVHIAKQSEGYAISVDTHGTLAWSSSEIDGKPLICIVSESASHEYLDYLHEKEISYIAVGKTKIDLPKAMEILWKVFGVRRLAILGGGIINGGFLEAGLIDEVSLLLSPGIDGRKGRVALFDGIPDTPRDPVQLKLTSAEQFPNGTMWLRYDVFQP